MKLLGFFHLAKHILNWFKIKIKNDNYVIRVYWVNYENSELNAPRSYVLVCFEKPMKYEQFNVLQFAKNIAKQA